MGKVVGPQEQVGHLGVLQIAGIDDDTYFVWYVYN